MSAGTAQRLAAKAEKSAARRGRRTGLLVGAVAGIAVGLLVAPKTGKETRALLFGEGGLSGQVDKVRGALGAGKESAADQSEALRRKIEETRERLRRQMDLGGEPAVGGDEPGGEDAPGAGPGVPPDAADVI